jgi:hypothetical protein
MRYEPVKIAAAQPTDPDAIPVPVEATSSFWTLPPEERERIMRDLETYRRELPRLIEEGHVGRYAVVRDDRVMSVWDTAGDALQAAQIAFGSVPVAVYPVKVQDLERFKQLEQSKSTTCQPSVD